MGADPPARSDEDLLRATIGGDEDAFLEIYRRHGGQVYRFAYRMTGSAETARDVTQSCFAGLLEAPARYDARRSGLSTYLRGAVRNLSLRRASRVWREAGDDAIDRRASSEASPLDALLERERAERVRRAVLSLAPLHREALILVEYEELDLRAVARLVGAEVGAVKVRLHRARQKLRRLLEAGARADIGGARR